MVDLVQTSNKGAPIKALLLITLCWVGGRFLWENTGNDLQKFDNQIALLPVQKAGASGIQLPYQKKSENLRILVEPFKHEHSFATSKGAVLFVEPRSKVFKRPISLSNAQKIASLKQQELPLQSALNGYGPNAAKREPISNIASTKNSGGKLSGYFWIFGRQNSPSGISDRNLANALSPPSVQGGQYGGSQAGAILSYRLLGAPQRNISAYLRASTALSISGEEEIAIGIKAKPVKNIPVTLYAEQRFSNLNQGNRSTALYVTAGTGPDVLVHDVNLQTYGQAGYVFGDTDSYFYDASAVIEKPLLSTPSLDIAVGGGVWTGGQENVRRVDIGPRISAQAPIFNHPMRVSVEWRQRVEGNARPGSGLAVTMSAGF